MYVIYAAAVCPTCSQQHVYVCIGSSKSLYLFCHSVEDLFRQDQTHAMYITMLSSLRVVMT